ARGYGKRRPGVVVVGTGGVPLVSPADGGDESGMLARRFPGPGVTANRRVGAARGACPRCGVDTIVLDDGFQHRRLARDADLVLLAEDPAARHLLPAGTGREPPVALRRARAVLVVAAGAGALSRPAASGPAGARRRRRLERGAARRARGRAGGRGRGRRAAGALRRDARALRRPGGRSDPPPRPP